MQPCNHVTVPIFGLPWLYTPIITDVLTPISKAKLERPNAFEKSAKLV